MPDPIITRDPAGRLVSKDDIYVALAMLKGRLRQVEEQRAIRAALIQQLSRLLPADPHHGEPGAERDA